MINYIAHTSEDGREQKLIDHLTNVGELARGFCKSFDCGDFAYKTALCHDAGKYSDLFQRRIKGANVSVDHSTAGGQLLYKKNDLLGFLSAYCIMGHHGGMPNCGSDSDGEDEGTLRARLNKKVEDFSAYASELNESIQLSPPDIGITDGFSLSFFIRMIYSALVDADWLDTEDFMSEGKIRRGGFDSIATLNKAISDHIKPFFSPSNELNAKRTELLQDCISAAEMESGLFTLTAPTGSGKTISSAAFALAHAAKHGKERIIYVVPYNTIIEQNAKIFEDILGVDNVLQHHSNIEYDNDENSPQYKKLLATENWDAPFIVTSSVRFFESLFSNKPSACRKLHSISNSVIVFDEAQMIPVPCLIPCTSIIRELVTNYRCTAVLATATQSSLDDYFQPEEMELFKPVDITEIVSKPKEMYEFFRRVNFDVIEDPLSNEELAERLNTYSQVLCIVNTRKRAQSIVGMIDKDVLHLSTTMVPVHRTEVLDEIRRRLSEGENCRVVSTSLVEAGVDVDFPGEYREIAGLDSIIQAAGRCNREGTRPRSESIVHIFESAEGIPKQLSVNVAAYMSAVRNYDDIASLDAIEHYFEQLRYIKGKDALDEKSIVTRLNKGLGSFAFPFADVAKDFRIIDQNTETVLIPYNEEAVQLADRLRGGERTRELFRAVQKYSVTLYNSDIRKMRELGVIEGLPGEEKIYILANPEIYYSDVFGITLEPTGGYGLFGE